MQKLTYADPISPDILPKKGSTSGKTKNNTKKHSLKIIEECARKEGISLSERMWAQLEKAVEINWR